MASIDSIIANGGSRVQNIAQAITQGINNANILEQAPLIKKMQEQQIAQNDFNLNRAQTQAKQQDQLFMDGQKDGQLNNMVRQVKFRQGVLRNIQNMPEEQRSGFIASMNDDVFRSLNIDKQRLTNPRNLTDAQIAADLDQADTFLNVFDNPNGLTAGEQERNALLRDLRSPDSDVKESAKIKLGLAPRAVGSASITTATTDGLTDKVAGSSKVIEGSKASGKSEGKNTEDRAQTVINDALVYSEQLPTIRRSLELLEEVKTGGFEAVKQKFAQSLGIEGENEGELSAALGKAVLSQLRATFGAAFTAKEGERLEQIEAGFGRNAKVNKRLLRNLEDVMQKKIDQGIQRARDRGDEETVRELEQNLSFTLDPTAEDNQQQVAESQDLGGGVKFLGFE